MYELLKKKSRLFSFGSNNAFLEFFLEGVPGLLQTQMDSKKVRQPLSLQPHYCFVQKYSNEMKSTEVENPRWSASCIYACIQSTAD